MEKIDKKIINRVSGGIINLHHSYLMKYKGRYSTSWAIMHARKDKCWEHGTSLHYIDENLDEGRIIDSWRCEIKQDDTAQTLFARVEEVAFEMFKSNYQKILNGVAEFLEPSQKTYFYGKDSNKSIMLPCDSSPQELQDYIRAWTFSGKPKPYIKNQGDKTYLAFRDNE